MAGDPAVPDMRLELVPLPVADVDRAKAFYQQAGFGNVHDVQVNETMRVVQLTPPGSSCAIVFGTGMGPITDMVPGSVKGLHLVVDDMDATRQALNERGIELSDVDDMTGSTRRGAAESGPGGHLGGFGSGEHCPSQPLPTVRARRSF
jgi:predicted enzyme related to lactoylglutathione lyase